jgi:preprotein translocase subunit SecA
MTTLNDLKENRNEIIEKLTARFGENNLARAMKIMKQIVEDVADNFCNCFQKEACESIDELIRYIDQSYEFDKKESKSDKVRGYVTEKFNEKAYWSNKLS